MSDTHKCKIFSNIFYEMNRLNTHIKIVHDTAPSAPPKIGQIVGILKITDGRGRMQGAGFRRQEAIGRR